MKTGPTALLPIVSHLLPRYYTILWALGAMPNGVAASKHASTMRPLDPLDNNQRSTTNYSVLGGATSGVGNMTSYDAGYSMEIKNDKTQCGQILQGGMNLYQGNINQDLVVSAYSTRRTRI